MADNKSKIQYIMTFPKTGSHVDVQQPYMADAEIFAESTLEALLDKCWEHYSASDPWQNVIEIDNTDPMKPKATDVTNELYRMWEEDEDVKKERAAQAWD